MFIKPASLIVAYALSMTAAQAAPVAYDYYGIQQDTLETFESYPTNVPGYNSFEGFSVDFSGGSSNTPSISYGHYCPTHCLIEKEEGEGSRTLLGFSSATKYVGFLLDTFWDNGYPSPREDLPDTFELIVLGNSGEYRTRLTPRAPQHLGYSDVSGLLSISVVNLGSRRGGWNYAFDDVVTSSGVASVPLPASAWLLGVALAGIGAASRRRK